ncbi:MAG: LytTR family DNA-binding domain-containing protein [Lacrimispora sp.]|uniref:LytR/AlgR family response regulator transcription factor n=1 Tax=Lacrimispora sp. TaxID=2719234 RepID=UPI0039E647F6
MVKIAICDDDLFICAQVEDILTSYANQNFMKISIDCFYSGESILHFLSQGNSFDLIYLDIELGKINGVEVGQHIRKIKKDYITDIVYISGKDSYYKQLFDVQPLNFIEKPIDPQFVINSLELSLEKKKKSAGFFEYQKGNETYKTEINNILYFESMNRRIKIVMTSQEDLFYGNLEEILILVSNYSFLRIHRSYLINRTHISILGYSETVMSNGIILPISRGRRQEIRALQMSERVENPDEY